MPSDCSHLSPITPVLTYRPAAGYFLLRPPEAATPHTHPSPLLDRDLVTVPLTVFPTRDLTPCVSPLQIVTSRRA